MATRNVAVSREERKRELETVEAAKREMRSAVARYAAAELEASDGSGGESHAALLDERVRRTALAAARLGLESALREDRSDCEAANAPACRGRGEPMRYVGRKETAVESADDVGVCIGDGAAWLWRLHAEWFLKAVAVVDFFPRRGVTVGGGALPVGPESDLGKQWALRQCWLFKAGRADKVLAALRRAGGDESARVTDYVAGRRGQMRYDE